MDEVIRSIAEWIENWTIDNVDQSPAIAVKNWGFAELANRQSKGSKGTSNQPIPMTINGTGDRQQIALDDRYDFIEWIRWVSPIQAVANPEDQWGLKEGKRKSWPLRIVIAHKVELGENLIDQIAENLPEVITLTGFDFIFLQNWSIDPNHEQIYNTELGETVYEQHRFNWNIYTIDLNVEFKLCVGFTPSTEYITDSDGNCLTVD
jgi:hypothetical protein